MLLNKILSQAVVILLSCLSAYGHQSGKEMDEPPVSIILLIGDGMGLAQISAGMMESDQPLNFERFKHIGLSKTSSFSHKITDSAAGATALSIGEKTYNLAIGINADTVAKQTILEYCSELGYATGFVVTSSVTHATPASFYAHQPTRHMNEAIAVDMVNAQLDFIAGGGLKYFIQRSDNEDLVKVLSQKGYSVKMSRDSLITNADKKQCYLLADDNMERAEYRQDYFKTYTQKAISTLEKAQQGFFLLVEGSQIDWGGHNNDIEYVIEELHDFDKAIGICLDYADKNPNTLVIVTADHETGGLSLKSEQGKYDGLAYGFSTDGHTATMVPVFAYGNGAAIFQGIYENTEIYYKIKSLLK